MKQNLQLPVIIYGKQYPLVTIETRVNGVKPSAKGLVRILIQSVNYICTVTISKHHIQLASFSGQVGGAW